MSFDESSTREWQRLIAALVVYPLWIWLAVRTKQCLQVISRHTIPYAKRTVWLIKLLALIVGAGGVFGVIADFGLPWFLAVPPAGIIVYFAVREDVQDVVPPKPSQEPSAYQSSWREYRHLRHVYMLSWLGFVAAFVTLILISILCKELPHAAQNALSAVGLVAVVASIVVIGFNQWKWFRWPCPRCGCSFRGFWARPWLPKRCVYCGLPREEKSVNRTTSQ